MKNIILLLLISSTINAQYFKGDSTGATDVTSSLTTFFKSVRDSSTIQFARNGKYKMDGTIVLTERNNITINGNGSQIFAVTIGLNVSPPAVAEFHHQWPRKRSQIAIRGGTNIKINNLHIKGGNPHAGMSDSAYNWKYEAQHGYDIEGIEGFELTNCTITDVYGDFVYLGRWSAGDESWTKHVKITGCKMQRNGRQGVALVGVSNAVIENNYIGYTRRATFDIEPDDASTGSRFITIRNNTIGPGVLLFVASGGQAGLLEDVRIEGNTLQGKTMNITVQAPVGTHGRRKNWAVINNTSDVGFNSPLALINFKRVENVTIISNKSPVSNTTDAVYFEEVCGFTVKENAFAGARTQIVQMNSDSICGIVDKFPLVISAGSDQTINVTTDSILLRGAATDADAAIKQVQWWQISGPKSVKITKRDSAATWVSGLDTTGDYSFLFVALSVKGAQGRTAYDTAVIKVRLNAPAPIPVPVSVSTKDVSVQTQVKKIVVVSDKVQAYQITTVRNTVLTSGSLAIGENIINFPSGTQSSLFVKIGGKSYTVKR